MDCPIDYFANKRARTAPRGGRAAPPPAPAELLGPRGPRQAARRGSRLQPGGDLSSPESGPVTRHIFAGSEAGEPHGPGRAGPRRLGPPASTPSGQSPLEPYRLGGPPGAPRPISVGGERIGAQRDPFCAPERAPTPECLPKPVAFEGRGHDVGPDPTPLAVSPFSPRLGANAAAAVLEPAVLPWPPRAPQPPSLSRHSTPGASRDPGQHLLGL